MTKHVDYDDVAPAYDRRYDRNRYDEVRDTLRRFLGEARELDVIEVGCGTGHWLAELRGNVRTIVGVEPSWAMLERAAASEPRPRIRSGRAESLALASGSLDRVFCVNAMHHFGDKPAFVREARRVLRPGGAVMVVGLDPHTGTDRWWVYDYFPSALPADLARYPSTAAIRDLLEQEGFIETSTFVAQHFPAAIPFELAIERGYVDRRATSQLMVIPDAEYEAGLRRMEVEQPVLRADLRVFATVGRLPG